MIHSAFEGKNYMHSIWILPHVDKSMWKQISWRQMRLPRHHVR